MKTIAGDLVALALAGEFDVIIHGCNCQCTMGAGIAKGIKQTFPAAYKADLATERGDRDKLGMYSSAEVLVGEDQPLIIVNGYTQLDFRRRKMPNVDYDAIRSVLKAVKTDFPDKRIGYPAIGAGLAGGDWEVIGEIIAEELMNVDHTFVLYRP